MKRKGRTSQRTILFRRNVNRDNEEWAHFLEGYREWLMEWDMLEYGDETGRIRHRHQNHPRPFPSHQPTAANRPITVTRKG